MFMLVLVIALVALIPAGLYLRWATAPLRLGYMCGRAAERCQDPAWRPGRVVRKAYRLGFEAGKRQERNATVTYIRQARTRPLLAA